MNLVDRIKADELGARGFVIVEEGHAKHKSKDSWRHLCADCGDWVMQVFSKVGKFVCRVCFRK